MKRVVLLPLDERPCNYDFPSMLYGENFEFRIPPKDIMGDKKTPASFEMIKKWLTDSVSGADGLIISIDTLLYGGIVPSRLHYLDFEELKTRLSVIRQLRKNNPHLKIYAFNLILRCPQYSSDDEEPSYYEKYGREIFLKGETIHKHELGLLNESQYQKLTNQYDKIIDKSDYEDYVCRRKVNLQVNLEVLKMLKEECFDFLLIPQDDASVYGFTAKDQVIVREYIKSERLQTKVYMYPGADEIALTLLAKMTNELNGKKLRVFTEYSSCSSKSVVPLYEDRPIGETVKYQLLANGCIGWHDIDTADIVLMLNCPSRDMQESKDQNQKFSQYDTERTLVYFCEQIEYYLSLGKKVVLGDIAYANGGDLELLSILNQKGILMRLAGYGGWNTSSNSLGTAISQGVNYFYNGGTKSHLDFLALRYVEDMGYCSYVRGEVRENHLEKMGFNMHFTGEKRGIVAELIKEELQKFIDKYLSSISCGIKIIDCYMPWTRTFEVALNIEYNPKAVENE